MKIFKTKITQTKNVRSKTPLSFDCHLMKSSSLSKMKYIKILSVYKDAQSCRCFVVIRDLTDLMSRGKDRPSEESPSFQFSCS